jgi:hypothetical protein
LVNRQIAHGNFPSLAAEGSLVINKVGIYGFGIYGFLGAIFMVFMGWLV